MSLLQICENVTDTIQIEKPTTIVSNTSETARFLLSACKAAVQDVRRFRDWSFLHKEHTFTTVASTAAYSLPSDYHHMIDGTAWDRTNYWQLRGPLSPVEWQARKSSILGDTVSSRKQYIIKATSGVKEFYLDPTPDSADDMVFDYISKYMVIAADDTLREVFTLDTDTVICDEYLVELGATWRMLKRLGLEYADERAEFEGELISQASRDGSSAILSLKPRNAYHFISSANVPDSGYGS